MATSTKTDVLAELAAREQKLERARAEARAVGNELNETRERFESLQGEMTRLYQEDPSSFDHNAQPLDSNSPAGKLAKKLGEIDLADVQARAQHARKIADAAEQSVRDFVAAHYAELLEAVEPQAQAVAAEVQRCGQAFHAAAQEYLGIAQRVDGWRGAASRQDRDLRRVRFVGIEHGSALVKQTEQFGQPVPTPTETR